MPRLAPQFNGKPAVIELRQTQGTWERDLEKKKLEIEKIKAYSNATHSLLLPIGITAVGIGAGMGLYYVGRGITAFAQAYLGDAIDNIIDTGEDLWNSATGRNMDSSYVTVLCVNGPKEGAVAVNQSRTWLAWGGINSAIFISMYQPNKTNFWQGPLAWAWGGLGEAIAGNEWLLIYGNFNKNAVRIEDLSPGWLYLNDMEGGSQHATEDYEFQGGDERGAPTETAWSIIGLTYEEWTEIGQPITTAWLDYMALYPNIYSQGQIDAARILMEQQQINFEQQGAPPPPLEQDAEITPWSIMGLTYEEWIAIGAPITQEYTDYVQEFSESRGQA